LTPYFEELFKGLVENAYRTDYEGTSADLALASFTALSSLCENAAPDSYIVLFDMLNPVLQLISDTLNPNNFGEKKVKELQDYLSGLLQIILVKVGANIETERAN
jgi:hypothetical protein